MASTEVTLLNLLKKWYANRTVDRSIWTIAEVGLGVAVAKIGDHAYAGVSAAAALFVVKEFVATKLAAAGGPVVPLPATP